MDKDERVDPFTALAVTDVEDSAVRIWCIEPLSVVAYRVDMAELLVLTGRQNVRQAECAHGSPYRRVHNCAEASLRTHVLEAKASSEDEGQP